MATKILYHGGPIRETFEGQRMDRDRTTQDTNVLGPGIYLTTDEMNARAYAGDWPDGVVHEVEIPTQGIRDSHERPRKGILQCIVRNAPDKDLLYNYGYENLWRDQQEAVRLYMSEDHLLDAVCGLQHDLFPDMPNKFTEVMVKCGVKGFVDHKENTVDHYVMYEPKDVKIRRIIKLERD